MILTSGLAGEWLIVGDDNQEKIGDLPAVWWISKHDRGFLLLTNYSCLLYGFWVRTILANMSSSSHPNS